MVKHLITGCSQIVTTNVILIMQFINMYSMYLFQPIGQILLLYLTINDYKLRLLGTLKPLFKIKL